MAWQIGMATYERAGRLKVVARPILGWFGGAFLILLGVTLGLYGLTPPAEVLPRERYAGGVLVLVGASFFLMKHQTLLFDPRRDELAVRSWNLLGKREFIYALRDLRSITIMMDLVSHRSDRTVETLTLVMGDETQIPFGKGGVATEATHHRILDEINAFLERHRGGAKSSTSW